MPDLLTAPSTATGLLVVKLGGAALESADSGAALFDTIAHLHAAGTARLVLVHGGGAAVDRHFARLNVTSERRGGIRLTPADQIDDVVAVLAGAVNTRLVGRLHQRGVPAVGLTLAAGRLARTVKANGYDFDPGCVGAVHSGDPALAWTLLDAGFLPVFSSIGLDDDGAPLNVNADHAAAGLAALLGADGIVMLTDVQGVLDADGAVISTLTVDDVAARIADGTIHGGMIPKVNGALEAAHATGAPVTIASGLDPDALAAIAAGARAGTTIEPAPRGRPTSSDRLLRRWLHRA